MYEAFYQLSADPFRLSPDPGFSFEHRTYRKAMIYMLHALQRAEGFIMVTGQPGTGKTTLVNDLVGTLKPDEIAVARIVSTQLSASDLLDLVAYSFKLDFEGSSKAKILIRLEVFLKREHLRGRRALLIIDEAQCMGQEVLEEVRLLTNIMVGNHQLLQVFLVGQEQLRETVNTPVLEQLHQRLIAATHLDPLEADDTRAYIRHRLHCVNWVGDPLFSTEVYNWIQQYSRGIPRQINQICSRLLLHGCVEEKHRLGMEDLKTVIGELRQEMLLPIGNKDTLEADSWPAELFDDTYEEEPQASPPVPQPVDIVTDVLPETARTSHNQPVSATDAERGMPVREPVPVVEPGSPDGSRHVDILHRGHHGQREATALPTATQDHEPGDAGQPQEGAGNPGKLVMWSGVMLVLVLVTSILALFITRQDSDQSAFYQKASVINPPGTQQLVQVAAEISEPVVDQPSAATPVIESLADDVARITASEAGNAMPVQDVVISEMTGQDKPDQGEAVAHTASIAERPSTSQGVENASPVSSDMTTGESPYSGDERITELLFDGLFSLEDDRLLIPKDDCAYFYFSQVLRLEPGNSDALHGIGKIAARYTELATAAFGVRNHTAANKYIVRGLSVHPYYVDLLVLRDRLNASLVNMTAVQPVPVVPVSGQESVDYLSRLKGF